MIILKVRSGPNRFKMHHPIPNDPNSITSIPDILTTPHPARNLWKRLENKGRSTRTPYISLKGTIEHAVPKAEIEFSNDSVCIMVFARFGQLVPSGDNLPDLTIGQESRLIEPIGCLKVLRENTMNTVTKCYFKGIQCWVQCFRQFDVVKIVHQHVKIVSAISIALQSDPRNRSFQRSNEPSYHYLSWLEGERETPGSSPARRPG